MTNWDTIKTALFSTTPTEAIIVAGAEPFISRAEYDLQDRPPSQRPGSTAVLSPGSGPGRPAFGQRFAVYASPVGAQPGAGRLLIAASEEAAKAPESTATNTAAQKIKEEGEKITEEAKHDEELAAREKTQAAAEQKSAEALAQEEQKKAKEAQKLAETTNKQGAAQAQAIAVKARHAVAKARGTARTKQRETVRPPTQRRIEVGTPTDRVEAVLHAAHLGESCDPTCALKPIVEKVLKATSSNVAAAKAVKAVAFSSSGARVHYDVTLKGLEDKVVVLTYSLVQTNGAPPPAPYLDTVAIKTFTPARNRELVVGNCWVPVPSSTQRYYVELTVYDGDTEVAYKDTNPFQ